MKNAKTKRGEKNKKNSNGAKTKDDILCNPGSSKECCLEATPTQRHLKAYHSEYFVYKNRNVYRVLNSLLFECPGMGCNHKNSLANIERHLPFCPKLTFVQDKQETMIECSYSSVQDKQELMHDDDLIYCQTNDSLIAFNETYGIAICLVHQVALTINYLKDKDGTITSIDYGSYHFKLHHFKDKNNHEWLSRYLLDKYHQNPVLFMQNLESSLTLQSQLSTLDNPISPINGLEITSGFQCLICQYPKRYFKKITDAVKESGETVYLWRHYKESHQEYLLENQVTAADVVTQSKHVLLQLINNVYFPILQSKRVNERAASDLLYQTLFPPSSLHHQKLALEDCSYQKYSSGLESKLHWTERCIALDLDPKTSGYRQELITCNDLVLEDLIENSMFTWIKKVNKCLEFFGINGLKEIAISRLTEETSKVYRQEWCNFVYFLFMASQSEKYSFVKGLTESCKKKVVSFHYSLTDTETEMCDSDIVCKLTDIFISILSNKLLLSSSDEQVFLINYLCLSTYSPNKTISEDSIQQSCTRLKYLFRGAVIIAIKELENNFNDNIDEINQKELKLLDLIPNEATTKVTYPFGRLNALSSLVSSLSPRVIKPIVEDCTITKLEHGGAIISQDYVSTSILKNTIQKLLLDGKNILKEVLLGFKLADELTENQLYKRLIMNPQTVQQTIGSSFSDWVTSTLGLATLEMNPLNCDHIKFQYFIHENESVRQLRLAEYYRKVDSLGCILLTLVHLTSGPPPRATEIASLLYRNTLLYDSSLVVSNGHLCLVYSYNKTNVLTKSTRVVVRPIAFEVAEIFIPFFAFIRPFCERLRKSAGVDTLWTQGDKPMTPLVIRDKIKQVSKQANFPISFQNFRHYVKFLAVKYLDRESKTNTGLFDINLGFGHSEDTGKGYGVTTADMLIGAETSDNDWNAMINTAVYFQLKILEMKSTIEALNSNRVISKPNKSIINLLNGSHVEKIKTDIIKEIKADIIKEAQIAIEPFHQTYQEVDDRKLKRMALNSSSAISKHSQSLLLHQSLRIFLRNKDASFKTKEQFMACEAVLTHLKNVIVVAPTGYGKTLCFSLPIFIEKSSINLLIMPLNSLVEDMNQNLSRQGLTCLIYNSPEWNQWVQSPRTLPVQIILVNYFNACKSEFTESIVKLAPVKRLIFDECNCVNDFNAFMKYNSKLVVLCSRFPQSQLLFLSATLNAIKLN